MPLIIGFLATFALMAVVIPILIKIMRVLDKRTEEKERKEKNKNENDTNV